MARSEKRIPVLDPFPSPKIHLVFTTQIRTLSAPWPYLSFYDTLIKLA